MSKLSPNFIAREIDCPCCGVLVFDPALLYALEAARAHFRRPIRVNSAYRCLKHNAKVGGAPNSMHRTGRAADIRIQGIDPAAVFSYFDATFGFIVGLGAHKSFTHVDVNSTTPGRRWQYPDR